MKESWTKDEPFINRVFLPVIKDFLLEFSESKEIKSSIDFLYKYKRSYVQINKYKRWLTDKGFIFIIREGKNERMKLTSIGKEMMKHFKKIIDLSKKLDEGGASNGKR